MIGVRRPVAKSNSGSIRWEPMRVLSASMRPAAYRRVRWYFAGYLSARI